MARTRDRLIIDIQGKQIPVTVSSEGMFWAEWEGDSFRSETFKGLRVKLLPKVRVDAKRVSLPAMLRDYHGEWKHILLIGIHGDNGNVLYTDEERKTAQLRRRDRRVFRVLTDVELRELKKLEAAVDVARDKVNAWLKPRLMEPGKVVRQAIGLPPEKNRDEPIDDDDDLT